MTINEVIAEIEKDSVFYDESGGGVTLSGGDPLFQSEFIYELVNELKQKGIHIALDTCGYAEQSTFEKVLPFIDLFLYDLKILDEAEHIKYTGVSNRLILSNLKFLLQERKYFVLRLPIIPGINDSVAKWESLPFLFPSSPPTLLPSSQNRLPEINLLPYHSLARQKYLRFGATNKLSGLPDMKKEELMPLLQLFESMGFKVKVGG